MLFFKQSLCCALCIYLSDCQPPVRTLNIEKARGELVHQGNLCSPLALLGRCGSVRICHLSQYNTIILRVTVLTHHRSSITHGSYANLWVILKNEAGRGPALTSERTLKVKQFKVDMVQFFC